ncbi:hypothetical protein QCA50_008761 [Cerrena zonata]|uniref:BZIP domain-containing protein n=1 Tax=Cerrena zonata TaxID=2478898 RepID=A0AAW0G3W6_9APHY
MVRGRKRDTTSEPSRALMQQREYRARKAQYQAELEARFNHLEEENEELRQEVAQLRMQVGTSRVTNSEPRIINAALDLRNQMNHTITSISHFTQRLPQHGLSLSTDVPTYQGVSYLPTPTPTEYMSPDTPISTRGRYNDDSYPTDTEMSPVPAELPPIVVTHPSPSPRMPSHPLVERRHSESSPVEEETVCCWGYVDCDDGTPGHPPHHPARGGDGVAPSSQAPSNSRRGNSNHFNTSDLRSTS